MREQVLRAYRFALDPTPEQLVAFNRHAGAARWAFNWAHGRKLAAHELRRGEITDLIEHGHTQASARKAATTRIPTMATIRKHLNAIKGDSRTHTPPEGDHGPHRPCAWWHEVSTYAFQSAMADADSAWDNWIRSLTGQRAGQRMGAPRFKKKNRARDSFRLYGAGLRLDGYRRLAIPRIGSVRLHASAKRLVRLIGRGDAALKCVTVSRSGSRWHASVLAEVTQDIPERPTRRQRVAGTVGVDLGVRALATLSQRLDPADPAGDVVAHPRLLDRNLHRLAKAQRAYSRTLKGSRRRAKAARRIGALGARIAEQRSAHHHQVTKRLVAGFATVAVEDLDLRALTASAAGTPRQPGRNVKVKARFTRFLLDAAPGEFRRQLTYKARWHGSTVVVLDSATPANRICSSCHRENPPPRLGASWFVCRHCDSKVARAVNSAGNIQRLADHVASDAGETRNARGAERAPGTRAGDPTATTREGRPRGSPRWSNPPAAPANPEM
ncbi:RNA-guided endonuclease InsQ/TnpB family protein [Embleya sp. NPDC001921]